MDDVVHNYKYFDSMSAKIKYVITHLKKFCSSPRNNKSEAWIFCNTLEDLQLVGKKVKKACGHTNMTCVHEEMSFEGRQSAVNGHVTKRITISTDVPVSYMRLATPLIIHMGYQNNCSNID
eukprot:TRINITY_DN9279_c0_g1_i1.p1 TRINITY_DN9279_c0_g1~~TRINITY_DN9279_c0_g1_i1.p1  ORF type:complete len:128 (+),score=17.14 TRINITY_DN9279_c0_g1_i1:22-384(+)